MATLLVLGTPVYEEYSSAGTYSFDGEGAILWGGTDPIEDTPVAMGFRTARFWNPEAPGYVAPSSNKARISRNIHWY